MTELTELEEEIRKLKKDNLDRRRLIESLKTEKKYLEERNRYLIEKLKQAGVLYEESAKRLMDFINTNIKPLKAKLDDFDSRLQKIKQYDISITSALKRIDEFGVIVGNFKNEMIRFNEKQATISSIISEMRKSLDEMSKRISKVQAYGSEELADKVEEIKAKFGEDIRKIEDEFNILKLGVTGTIENFRKEFERQSGVLRNEMEKVDIKKAKELSDALAHLTEELDKTKVEFSREISLLEKAIEKIDVKKTKEINYSLKVLSDNLEGKFKTLSEDIDQRIFKAEETLNKFKVELEKTLGKVKIETRDFISVKSEEFDKLLEEVKEKTKEQLTVSSEEWNK
ncbi:MAG: hypothetical protein QW412_03715, partial [Candidatus Aenigmatarchaeota archaeon]